MGNVVACSCADDKLKDFLSTDYYRRFKGVGVGVGVGGGGGGGAGGDVKFEPMFAHNKCRSLQWVMTFTDFV